VVDGRGEDRPVRVARARVDVGLEVVVGVEDLRVEGQLVPDLDVEVVGAVEVADAAGDDPGVVQPRRERALELRVRRAAALRALERAGRERPCTQVARGQLPVERPRERRDATGVDARDEDPGLSP
jgi:hypothetical protein